MIFAKQVMLDRSKGRNQTKWDPRFTPYAGERQRFASGMLLVSDATMKVNQRWIREISRPNRYRPDMVVMIIRYGMRLIKKPHLGERPGAIAWSRFAGGEVNTRANPTLPA